jgi:CDP-diacylglycerol--glycerol-3-phosphate 3-phosphatidyltransferase
VDIIASPTAFYERLLYNIEHANERVVFSSLYLGTGHLEEKLVKQIAKRIKEKPHLKVTFVLDFSRGQRGGQEKSSASLLKRLLIEFPNNFQLYLYKVPQLEGIKAALPPPFNETLGVSHTKVYLIDDTLILSGANLSQDYFTNRQDRYVQMSRCGGLAQFYASFVDIIASYSFQVNVNSKGTKYIIQSSKFSNDDRTLMKKHFEELVTKRSDDALLDIKQQEEQGNDTWAFPTIQFSPIKMYHDEEILTQLLKSLPKASSVSIASGYLNLPPFLDELLVKCHAHLDILTAAPIANGFYDANGIKGALPMAYSLIEQDFYEKTKTRSFKTTIREFIRPEWTFHGKGMWLSPSLNEPPQMTIFGSSNFGRRSYGCDMESQVVLFTHNPSLRQKLLEECTGLKEHAEIVTDNVWKRPDRMLNGFGWKYGHWIRPVAKLLSSYL